MGDQYPGMGQVVPDIGGNGKQVKKVVIIKPIFHGHQYQADNGHHYKHRDIDQYDPGQRISIAELLLDIFPNGGEHGLNLGISNWVLSIFLNDQILKSVCEIIF